MYSLKEGNEVSAREGGKGGAETWSCKEGGKTGKYLLLFP